MKRNNKKGFTIVELVIVIAVIAILAGVLIPTFAGVTTKAKKSAALQEATNEYKAFLAETEDANISSTANPDAYIKIVDDEKTYYFTVEEGKIAEATSTPTLAESAPAAGDAEQTAYVKSDKNAAVYVYTVVPANS